ncbi:hypothetical protein HF086_007420 [Spodoptera exigua]|uniref:DDE Tnp4 domain-containing protein n=1 Tax=Spodoptera exigua TaxID=7107 RepID=A0A922M8N4_SPOEX|nr:hypothetical protein HF086_007420 [Spodoptera exigua]
MEMCEVESMEMCEVKSMAKCEVESMEMCEVESMEMCEVERMEKYLATGCNFTDLHIDFKCGHTTARRIVKETVEVIKVIFMPEPTEESHLKTAEGFMKHANFPNIIGAIDGKHIRIIKPCHTGSEYYNYKHFFSIVLLAICDANYNFIAIDVGCYGKSSDSTIHDSSERVKKIREGNFKIPQPRSICNNGIPIPFSFIGDEGFALSEHLQSNYRLTRARRYIECTFGILSNKFKIFNRPINVNVDFATNIVRACCVLHNFIRKRDGYQFDHTLSIIGFQDSPASDNLHLIRRRRSELSGTAIRNIYTDYFTSEGSVPWQDSKI